MSPIIPAGPTRSIRIQRSHGWIGLDLPAVWDYRELIGILASRDVKVRYKQTALGVTWVVIQPLVTAGIFSVVFGNLAGLPSDGVPYFLFSLTGLVGWNFFSGSMTRAAGSVVEQAGLVAKVYFPRLIIPLSSALAAVVDLVVALCFTLAVMLLRYGMFPGWGAAWLLVFLPLVFALSLGVGLWVSALNVKYRDFAHALPFALQAWFYASPVAFSTTLIPERWRPLYALNPMVAPIEGIRGALLGRSTVDPAIFGVSLTVTAAVLVSGLIFFKRTERSFADVI